MSFLNKQNATSYCSNKKQHMDQLGGLTVACVIFSFAFSRVMHGNRRPSEIICPWNKPETSWLRVLAGKNQPIKKKGSHHASCKHFLETPVKSVTTTSINIPQLLSPPPIYSESKTTKFIPLPTIQLYSHVLIEAHNKHSATSQQKQQGTTYNACNGSNRLNDSNGLWFPRLAIRSATS